MHVGISLPLYGHANCRLLTCALASMQDQPANGQAAHGRGVLVHSGPSRPASRPRHVTVCLPPNPGEEQGEHTCDPAALSPKGHSATWPALPCCPGAGMCAMGVGSMAPLQAHSAMNIACLQRELTPCAYILQLVVSIEKRHTAYSFGSPAPLCCPQALPTSIGSEMEDLFGTMVEEMSSRETGGGDGTAKCEGSTGIQDAGSNSGESGQGAGFREVELPGSNAAGRMGMLRRRKSAPALSAQRAPSEASTCRCVYHASSCLACFNFLGLGSCMTCRLCALSPANELHQAAGVGKLGICWGEALGLQAGRPLLRSVL